MGELLKTQNDPSSLMLGMLLSQLQQVMADVGGLKNGKNRVSTLKGDGEVDLGKVNEKLRMPRIPYAKENGGLPFATTWLDWMTRKFPPWASMIQEDFDTFVLQNLAKHRAAPLPIEAGKSAAHYKKAIKVLGYELSQGLDPTLSPYFTGIDARDGYANLFKLNGLINRHCE